ncbi:hypothetical protein UFOVP20_52 [uncultured Caudovirales phage]|uniref:Uncharacterized protein n=1 Tax=uncultured Caudovirales phage TaxID=2100421 RepID=A0A6J5KKW7_9CAUD|nr:hypothetical protein UFOVP20_52 [uncultured Caudovirales phage]
MGLRFKAPSLGTVEMQPVDTASNVTLTVSAKSGVLSYADSSTGGFYLPVGTTAQRPTAATGMIRYNSTTGAVEVYNGTSWG